MPRRSNSACWTPSSIANSLSVRCENSLRPSASAEAKTVQIPEEARHTMSTHVSAARRVRFVDPAKLYRQLKSQLDDAYHDVMSNGELVDRRQLREFEVNLAAFVGTRYAVGLNSGYDALHVSLRAAGVQAGDEVIVQAHTFVATCSAVVNVGATPVLVDVRDDFNV